MSDGQRAKRRCPFNCPTTLSLMRLLQLQKMGPSLLLVCALPQEITQTPLGVLLYHLQ